MVRIRPGSRLPMPRFSRRMAFVDSVDGSVEAIQSVGVL